MQTAVLLAMMALVLPLAVPAAATAPSTSPRDMDLLHVSLSDLQAGSPEVMEAIRSAVTNVGVFAVVGSSSPGVQGAALREYAMCVSGAATELGHDSQTVFTPTPASTPLSNRPVVLADTTRRTTVATATNASQAIPFSEKVSATCPSFVGASAALRKGVDDTAHAYAAALDALAGGLGESYAAHVAEGESLEHFHLFTRDLPPVDDKALHMHSDMGLFIVMTPAEFVELSTGEAAAAAAGQPHGLYLELPSGEVVRPALQSDSLLVMNGEGSHVWVESPLGEQLSVPRHEVDFPHIEGVGRVWFGRMVLPKRSALLQQQKTGDESTLMTFNQYRNQMFNVFHNGSAEAKMGVGCHPTQASSRFLQRHLLVEHAEADSCNSTQIYCWLSCMEIPDGCTADTVECQNSETRALWVPEDSHCMNCAPVCLTDGSMTGGSGGGMTDMNTLNVDATPTPLTTTDGSMTGGSGGGMTDILNVDVTPTPTPTPAVDSAVPATVIPFAAIISLAATLLAALLPVY